LLFYTDAPFHFVSQYHYDALGEFIVRYIQEQMISTYNLTEMWVPQSIPAPQYPVTAVTLQTLKTSNIFVSKDAFTCDKLMLIIQGSGAVRAGMWARALCMNESLETGTIFNYLKQAKQENYGVVVFNPNLNRVPKKLDPLAFTRKGFFHTQKPKPLRRDDCEDIALNSSPPEHVIHVWDQIVEKMCTAAKDIVIVAHSAGGYCTMELLRNRYDQIKKRVRGIGFTDSVHSVERSDPPLVKQFVMQNAINWVTSDKPLDTELRVSPVSGCLCVSAGHEKHENTNESARTSVFTFLGKKVAQQQKQQ